MTVWTQINTTQTPIWSSVDTGLSPAFEFNSFATLAYAEGAFADGSTGDLWEVLATDQTPNWTLIST
jgi:hypothetical protein